MKVPMKRPGHATVVAYLALFVALGGTGYAAATIGSAEVIDNSLTSKDIKNGEVSWYDLGPDSVSTYKIVPGAVMNSDIHDGVINSRKVTDNSLTAADIGPNAVGASELARAQAWRPVLPAPRFGDENPDPTQAYFEGSLDFCGDVGCPWDNSGSGADNEAGYFKDLSGVVHLRGAVGCSPEWLPGGFCEDGILTLPEGYRPAAVEVFTAWATEVVEDPPESGNATYKPQAFAVTVHPNGRVEIDTRDHYWVDVSLDGMTYRAAGS